MKYAISRFRHTKVNKHIALFTAINLMICINLSAQIIQYDYIRKLSDTRSIGYVTKGEVQKHFIDESGALLNELDNTYEVGLCSDGYCEANINDSQHIIDYDGNVIASNVSHFDLLNNTVVYANTYDQSNNKLYGIKDTLGNVVISPKYKNIEYCNSNEFIVTDEDDKVGIIDREENIVLPLIYEYLHCYYENQSIAATEDSIYLIDRNFRVIKPIEKPFGFYRAKSGYVWFILCTRNSFYLSKRGATLKDSDIHHVYTYEGDTIYLNKAKVIIDQTYNNSQQSYHQLYPNLFVISDDQNLNIGDIKGNLLHPDKIRDRYFIGNHIGRGHQHIIQFEEEALFYNKIGHLIRTLKANYISSSNGEPEKHYLEYKYENKWGLVDVKGNIIIEPQYKKIELINDYSFIGYTNDTPIVYDLNENIISDISFTDFKKISGNRYLVASNNNIGVIDKSLNFLIPPEYTMIAPTKKSNHYIARQDSIVSILDLDGNEIIIVDNDYSGYDLSFYEIKSCHNTFRFHEDGSYGIKDINNNEIISNQSYWPYHISDCKYYQIPVERRGLSGLVDTSNQVILKSEYDGMENIYRAPGYFIVEKKDRTNLYNNHVTGLADSTGNILTTLKYYKISVVSDILDNKHFVFQAEAKEGLDYFNQDGSKMSKKSIIRTEQISEGYYVALSAGKYGIIDSKNNVIIPYNHNKLNALSDTVFTSTGDKSVMYKYNLIAGITDSIEYKENKRYDCCYYTSRVNEFEGLIYKDMSEIIPPIYDSIESHLVKVSGTYVSFYQVNKGNHKGIIDKMGNTIVPVIYDNIENYSTYFICKNTQSNKVIDYQGKVVLEDFVDYTIQSRYNISITMENGETKYFDPKWNEINR